MLPGAWDRDFIITDIPNWRIVFLRDGTCRQEDGNTITSQGRWEYDEAKRMLSTDKSAWFVKKISYGYMVLDNGEPYAPIAFARQTTELDDAICNGNLEKVRFLLDHGFDANTLVFNSYSPLHLAVRLDDPVAEHKLAILTCLLEKGAAVSQQTMYQDAPINCVSGKYKRETAALLLAHGANINHQGNSGMTLLHDALAYASTENPPDWDFIEYPLEQKADITGAGNALPSPLCFQFRDFPEKIPELIALACNPSLKGNADLLLQAVWWCNFRLVHSLQARGVNVNVSAKRADKISALHASVTGHDGSVAIVALLLAAGAKPDAADYQGDTSLHHVCAPEIGLCSENAPTFIRILAAAGTSLNSRNERGRTALHEAASRGTPQAVKTLLELGVCKDCQDNDGDTPLHIAVRNAGRYNEWRGTIGMLLSAGAAIDVRNNKGQTCLDIAAQQGNQDLKKFLSKRGKE